MRFQSLTAPSWLQEDIQQTVSYLMRFQSLTAPSWLQEDIQQLVSYLMRFQSLTAPSCLQEWVTWWGSRVWLRHPVYRSELPDEVPEFDCAILSTGVSYLMRFQSLTAPSWLQEWVTWWGFRVWLRRPGYRSELPDEVPEFDCAVLATGGHTAGGVLQADCRLGVEHNGPHITVVTWNTVSLIICYC